jgi:hypothetical protein
MCTIISIRSEMKSPGKTSQASTPLVPTALRQGGDGEMVYNSVSRALPCEVVMQVMQDVFLTTFPCYDETKSTGKARGALCRDAQEQNGMGIMHVSLGIFQS